jgi:prepilin-type N-terminal cleavage/methylation domain-containing protein
MKQYTNRQKKGFTILEMLLVVTLIAILLSISLVAINPNRSLAQARNLSRKVDIKNINDALEAYKAVSGSLIVDKITKHYKEICDTGNKNSSDSLPSSNYCEGKLDLRSLVPIYISSIPKDSQVTESGGTGYEVAKDKNNKITIKATKSELNELVAINLPDDSIYATVGFPNLDLNFAKNKNLIDDISGNNLVTFTRNSIGTYVGSDGLIKTAAVNEPRFDHNPITGESLGLLVEDARTNLIVGSDYLTNNSLQNVNLTLNATTAPDGTNTAVSMDGSTNNSNLKYMYKQYSTNNTGAYTTSVFMKYKNERFVVLRMNDDTGVNGVVQKIDILNGIFTNIVETGGTLTNASSTITPYPNGWYRISVSGVFNDPLIQVQGAEVFLTTYGPSISTNGVYLWGPQLEQGAFPTSYIPTSSSIITRGVDNASITGTNFSNFYNQDETTMFAHSKRISNFLDYGRVASFNNDSYTNILALYVSDFSNSRYAMLKQFNGSPTFFDAPSVSSITSPVKSAISNNSSDVSIASAGQVRVPTVPIAGALNVNKLLIGAEYYNASTLNGSILRLTYWPIRIPNDKLQAITK